MTNDTYIIKLLSEQERHVSRVKSLKILVTAVSSILWVKHTILGSCSKNLHIY